MLDEVAQRGPNFREGYPVVMADGQVWQIPCPIIRWLAGRSGAGFRTVVFINDTKTDYDTLIAQFETSQNADGQINATFGMARQLILSNYVLDDDQLDEILVFGVNENTDPEHTRIYDEIRSITLGNGPKPSAAGGASVPTPAA